MRKRGTSRARIAGEDGRMARARGRPAMRRDVAVREATSEDLPGLIGLWEEYMREMAKIIRIWGDPNAKLRAAEERRMKAHFRSGGKAFVLQAGRDARLVGMLWVKIDEAPPSARVRQFGYVSQVFVQRGYRGRGLSRRMLQAAFRWLRKKKIAWSSLYVMADNRGATKAWERLGYGFVAHYMGRRI